MNNLSKVFLVTTFLFSLNSKAHFQVIKAGSDVINDISISQRIDLSFMHPMEQTYMPMKRPEKFGVMLNGKKKDLAELLKKKIEKGKSAWYAQYSFKMPGDYIFYVIPQPYWEPAEQKMIIHYSKLIVDVLGAEDGWDDMIGFPVEIKPLSCPYSLYKGNIFRGIVKRNGKAVPFAEIEVELFNNQGALCAPSDVYITQVIKADSLGVFSYVFPVSGWWGFAALLDGDKTMKNPEGKLVDVELGAVLWLKVEPIKK
ncbi:MAG: DUF4198 domain-containing protein [Verrucomicrobiota bacterium]|nr:DUF4198 domain-containing protein [Verrucomicrobiota bacterium]